MIYFFCKSFSQRREILLFACTALPTQDIQLAEITIISKTLSGGPNSADYKQDDGYFFNCTQLSQEILPQLKVDKIADIF